MKALQVAILCGGRGRRLGSVTASIPKALVELNGRSILDHVVDSYVSKGLRRFILCLGYKAEQVRRHFEEPPHSTEIHFSDSGEHASMLTRVWECREIMEERLLVSYCDTFIDLDLEAMLNHHLEMCAKATIVTAMIRSPFGLVGANPNGWVTSFQEKPFLNYYIGSFIVERSAIPWITPEMLERPDGEGLVELFEVLSRDQQLAAFEHKGLQITFNTEGERQKAEEDLGRFYTYREDA